MKEKNFIFLFFHLDQDWQATDYRLASVYENDNEAFEIRHNEVRKTRAHNFSMLLCMYYFTLYLVFTVYALTFSFGIHVFFHVHHYIIHVCIFLQGDSMKSCCHIVLVLQE